MDEKTPITVFETAAFNRSATPPDDGIRLAGMRRAGAGGRIPGDRVPPGLWGKGERGARASSGAL